MFIKTLLDQYESIFQDTKGLTPLNKWSEHCRSLARSAYARPVNLYPLIQKLKGTQ